MESIKNLEDVNSLKNNKLIGNPELVNSSIQFNGSNNILVCEGNINLINSQIVFQGDNSIIYLSYTKHDYNLNLFVRNNSTIFIGKNNELGSRISINVQEHQNVVIGDDGIIGNEVTFRTCDAHGIYDLNSKERINFSESIFIGDHVWIDHFAYISRGVNVGSGSIIGINSFIPPSCSINSNNYVFGNPVQLIRDNVFFTKEFTGVYTEEDTLNFSAYKSEVYKFDFVNGETLSFINVDKILKKLSVDERLEFIEKLFVKNKCKNRFSLIR